jgi:hypothetical protein
MRPVFMACDPSLRPDRRDRVLRANGIQFRVSCPLFFVQSIVCPPLYRIFSTSPYSGKRRINGSSSKEGREERLALVGGGRRAAPSFCMARERQETDGVQLGKINIQPVKCPTQREGCRPQGAGLRSTTHATTPLCVAVGKWKWSIAGIWL